MTEHWLAATIATEEQRVQLQERIRLAVAEGESWESVPPVDVGVMRMLAILRGEA